MPDIVSPGIVGSRPGRRLPEWVVVLAAAVALSVVMTWPLAPRLSRMGRVDSTDAMYAMWNVAWVARTLTTAPSEIFNANIFYPHKGTLAFSESNLLTGMLGIPAWLLTKNVYATYNSVTLIGFILSFLCSYALARRLTGSPLGAAVAAIGFAFCPFVYARFPHIQLQMTFGIPLSLLALHRLVDKPAWQRGVGLGLALAAQGLTCAYYGILAGLSVGFGVLFFAGTRRLWTSRGYWIAVGVALVTCLLFIVPVFVPYLTVQEAGFQRTLEEARRYAFGWRSWLASPTRSHGWMVPWLREGGWRGGVLFPGFVTSIAGVAGLLIAMRGTPVLRAGAREAALFYTLLGIFALWLSFGPDAGLYTLLYHTVPVFRLLRAPERFGIEVMLALAIGSAFAAAWLARWLRRAGRQPLMAVMAAGAVLLSVADKWIAPLNFREALPVPSPYYMLARLPRQPVAEFPYFRESFDLNRHAQYMFFSTYHWQPLINGYSDHMPKDFYDTLDVLSGFPSRASFAVLQARGVRYVAVHLNWYHHQVRPEVERRLAHYAAQGALQYLDHDVKTGADGRVLYDVELYQIVQYPGDRAIVDPVAAP